MTTIRKTGRVAIETRPASFRVHLTTTTTDRITTTTTVTIEEAFAIAHDIIIAATERRDALDAIVRGGIANRED